MIKHTLMMVLFFVAGYALSFTVIKVSSKFVPPGTAQEFVMILAVVASLIAGLVSAAFYNYYTENNY